MNYDFCGWATKNNLRCSDGRTIIKDAFADCDGKKVPLVWNHQHTSPADVLGHALLENREEGVYAYASFNDTPLAQSAKLQVMHGDINQLSIYANQLKQQGSNVLHGAIREVSLVLAGANPGAFIESVIKHGEECDEEGVIFTGEEISLYHADDNEEENQNGKSDDNKTVQDVFDTLTEEQKTVVYAMIGQALETAEASDDKNNNDEGDDEMEHSEGGEKFMKHNVFESNGAKSTEPVLTHAMQEDILSLAKSNQVGSFRDAVEIYAAENAELAHGIVDDGDINQLFPDFKDLGSMPPETVERDQSWVESVISGAAKSPISRIRTRHIDATDAALKAIGYKKGDKKKDAATVTLMKRTTEPQTIYIKDSLHRDDIIDITDFDIVSYQYALMKRLLKETLAKAILIGDGAEDEADDKIKEDRIRSIWNDDELYTIHQTVNFKEMSKTLNGTDATKHFGENYIKAEAIIAASLFAREKYKGSGNLTFFCTPHLLNVMLLARDLNGRRVYNSKADLEAALNVSKIETVEQFEGQQREDNEGDTRELLGLFVNMHDYQLGCTKGGEITQFDDFDINFNKYQYLIETRLSGALVKLKSAIALEVNITDGEDQIAG